MKYYKESSHTNIGQKNPTMFAVISCKRIFQAAYRRVPTFNAEHD